MIFTFQLLFVKTTITLELIYFTAALMLHLLNFHLNSLSNLQLILFPLLCDLGEPLLIEPVVLYSQLFILLD